MKSPLGPFELSPSELPAASTIESSSSRFSPIVPSPVPVLAVTVQVVPPPVTPVIAGLPMRPVTMRSKSGSSTPLTDSLKMTVQLTLEAFVGVPLTRLMETT